MHMYTKYQMSISIGSNVMANVKVDNLTYILTFDIEGWPWPWHITPKICGLMRYTFLPNIKSLSVMAQKLWPMLKLHGQDSIFIFEEWPWPCNVITEIVQLNEMHLYTKYQMSICIRSKVMANVKMGNLTLYCLPLTLKDGLTYYPSKCAPSWDTYAC